MVTITREQAISMFYHEPYDKHKAIELLKSIKAINVDICYKDDPCKPFLLYEKSIYADPYSFHTYKEKTTPSVDSNEAQKIIKKIVNLVQLINFLNTVYLPINPYNEQAYDCQSLTMNDILAVVWKHTDILNEKTAQGFSKWCGNKKLKLIQATAKRRLNEIQQKTSVRSLYVLKNKFFDGVIEDIVEHLPRYQVFIKSFKEDGYFVVGYVRKSTNEKDDQTRVRLLDQMCKNLKERSLVSKVFASVSCNADEELLTRDKERREDLLSQIDADGDMQDMLSYISTKEKVCIAAIDFVGLTTNQEDLKVFLENNPNVRKIIIDKLPYTNSTHVYDSHELLNSNKITEFDCRNILQRSK